VQSWQIGDDQSGLFMSSATHRRPASSGFAGALRSWFDRGIPVATASEFDARGVEAASVPAHSEFRVLVADDNPVNLAIVSALLEQRGITPQLAADGAEAVELACTTTFDIILMDLLMPVLNGLEATVRIRQIESMQSRAHTPVLAYSSMRIPGAVLDANGLDGALNKPCSAQELDDCMVRWCPRFEPQRDVHARA
jgi:CheY-like chemotaxis protein